MTQRSTSAVAIEELDPAPPHRPDFEVLSRVRRSAATPRVRSVAIAILVVLTLALAQVGLSILLAQGSFQLTSLQQRSTKLAQSSQSMQEQLSALSSPESLARMSQKLGMTSSKPPLYLRLSDGKTLGTTKKPKGAIALTPTTTSLIASAPLQSLAKPATSANAVAAAAQSTPSFSDVIAQPAQSVSATSAAGAPQWKDVPTSVH